MREGGRESVELMVGEAGILVTGYDTGGGVRGVWREGGSRARTDARLSP